jgi:Protein of unknown function, DUF481
MPIAFPKHCVCWLALTNLFWCASASFGQSTPPASNPDVLQFIDGERLTGHFVKATGTAVTFHSDALGDITVDWKKVKELTSAVKVAVIPKGVRIRKQADASSIPQGTLTVQDQQVHLAAPAPPAAPAAPAQTAPIPLSGTNAIIDEAGFEKALRHQPFLQDWKGTVTIGVAVVNATQDSESFTGAIALVRAVPTENWLEPRNKTILDLSDSYGEVTQPATPTIKTSIFHGDAERDEYFSPRLFAFGQGAFDHNYSQGLDLQQTYSGGIGWSLILRDNEALDIKGSASYIRQQFMGAPNESLIGSIFGEDFNRKFKHATLDQHLTLTPTWNNTHDYAAAFNALLTVPVYKRLNGSAGFIETFLNDPAPGFRKSALQITLGVTYTVQ